jgi:hypothetical protein
MTPWSTYDQAVDTPELANGPQLGGFGRDYAVKFTDVALGPVVGTRDVSLSKGR